LSFNPYELKTLRLERGGDCVEADMVTEKPLGGPSQTIHKL